MGFWAEVQIDFWAKEKKKTYWNMTLALILWKSPEPVY